MAMTPDERRAVNNTRLLFGKTTAETKEFFESIGISAVMSYMRGDEIVIPFIGTLKLTYKGDSVDDNGLRAELDAEFTPSNFLVRNIGQVEDDVKTDAELLLLQRLRNIFRSKLNR